jgi:hypothetical protein
MFLSHRNELLAIVIGFTLVIGVDWSLIRVLDLCQRPLYLDQALFGVGAFTRNQTLLLQSGESFLTGPGKDGHVELKTLS